MATAQDVAGLRELSEKAQQLSVERLVWRSEWGTIKFSAAEPLLKTAFYLFNAFATLPVEILPDQELRNVVDVARRVMSNIEQIDKFAIETQENPRMQSEALTNSLRGEVDSFLRTSSPVLPFLAYYRGDIQAQLAKIEEGVAKASKLYDDGNTSLQAKAKQIDDALAAARTAAAKAGAAVFTQDFLDESSRLEKSADTWLKFAAGFGAAALVTALISFFWLQPSEKASLPYVIQYTVTKLVVIGGFLTGAIWCGSIYRALRHQASTNKHRGNALKTFQAFVEAAGDQQDIRSAVLLETTRSIFAIAPTGFLNATETNADSGPKIADTLKAMGKGS